MQALPDQMLAVEPERRAGDAGFQVDQQIGVLAVLVAFLIAGQLVRRQATKGGDLFGVAFRQAVDGQPK